MDKTQDMLKMTMLSTSPLVHFVAQYNGVIKVIITIILSLIILKVISVIKHLAVKIIGVLLVAYFILGVNLVELAMKISK